jgi:hypothetical protein
MSRWLHAPTVLHLGKQARVPMETEWAPEHSEYYRDRNLLLMPGIEPRLLGRPACSLVAVSTELSHPLKVHANIVLKEIRISLRSQSTYQNPGSSFFLRTE